jgi:hypothetical protein
LRTAVTIEHILGFGHENIQSAHPATLMFTKEKGVSKTGDCIVVVAADKAVTDLSPKFKEALRKPNSKITILIEAGGLTQKIHASGSPNLILTHSTDVVIRKSDYISDRTLAICADKSSNDLPREFVRKLKSSAQKVSITLKVNV